MVHTHERVRFQTRVSRFINQSSVETYTTSEQRSLLSEPDIYTTLTGLLHGVSVSGQTPVSLVYDQEDFDQVRITRTSIF